MKVLVVITPGGLISCVSEAFCGSTSDRQAVFEHSSLPQMCDAGGELMADKGFSVEGFFLPYQVTINMPTFFRK